MVGGGIFEAPATHRTMASVMPEHATWLRQAAASFQPESNQITLADGSTITYKVLIVAPGIRLAWEKIDGLRSEERRVGKACVSSFGSRWLPDHYKKKIKKPIYKE